MDQNESIHEFPVIVDKKLKRKEKKLKLKELEALNKARSEEKAARAATVSRLRTTLAEGRG